MGEMADYINENGALEDLYLYGPGGTKTCRYCGTDGLWWENDGSRHKPVWRLANDNGIHVCPTKEVQR